MNYMFGLWVQTQMTHDNILLVVKHVIYLVRILEYSHLFIQFFFTFYLQPMYM